MATATAIAPILFGTAGHVDHGKSTLVRGLTGINPDRFEEEQRRGMTIDLGYSRLQLPELEIGFVDVPGHEGFVKNMVVGAAGVDAVLLVVAADEGVMPQTREHLAVCELLGAKGGVCALTKIDMVDDELAELAADELRDQLQGTFLQDAAILPVSVPANRGLEALTAEIQRLATSLPPRPTEGPYRLPIHRVFSAKGQGTIVTGVPLTGTARLGDTLEVVERPGKKGAIRAIQAYWHQVEESRPGHTAGLNLRGLDASDVQRGFTLATPGIFTAGLLADAHARWLDVAPPLHNGMECFAHVGSAQVAVKLHVIGSDIVRPGESAYLQLELEEPTIMVPGDRFILRTPSPPGTVGGGVILGATPGQRKRRRLKAYTHEELERRHAALADPRALLEDVCVSAGGKGLAPAEAAQALAMLPNHAKAVAEQAIEDGRLAFDKRAKRYFAVSVIDGARQTLLDRLGEFHAKQPHRAGMTHATITSALSLVPEAARALLARAVADGAVTEAALPNGDAVYSVAGFAPRLSETLAAQAERLLATLAESPFETPDIPELDDAVELAGDDAQTVVDHLRETGRVVVLEVGLYAPAAIDDAGGRLVELIEHEGAIGLATFRDMLGTSRKHAQRLLDHLTKTGVVEHVPGSNLRQLKS